MTIVLTIVVSVLVTVMYDRWHTARLRRLFSKQRGMSYQSQREILKRLEQSHWGKE